jgi:hypothetical protein
VPLPLSAGEVALHAARASKVERRSIETKTRERSAMRPRVGGTYAAGYAASEPGPRFDWFRSRARALQNRLGMKILQLDSKALTNVTGGVFVSVRTGGGGPGAGGGFGGGAAQAQAGGPPQASAAAGAVPQMGGGGGRPHGGGAHVKVIIRQS